MIESLVNSSTGSEPKKSSWNYASFEIVDPLGFHARPAMWVCDAGLFCPGKIQIALSREGEDPASAKYIGIESIMKVILYASRNPGKILNVRYKNTDSSEVNTAVESIREGMTKVWNTPIRNKYS